MYKSLTEKMQESLEKLDEVRDVLTELTDDNAKFYLDHIDRVKGFIIRTLAEKERDRAHSNSIFKRKGEA